MDLACDDVTEFKHAAGFVTKPFCLTEENITAGVKYTLSWPLVKNFKTKAVVHSRDSTVSQNYVHIGQFAPHDFCPLPMFSANAESTVSDMEL